jgi:hypothetical protein
MYSALMGWIVSFTTTLRISAEAGEENSAAKTVARTSREGTRDIRAFFLGYLAGKIFSFFGLETSDMVCWRQNLEPEGVISKILRNKDLARRFWIGSRLVRDVLRQNTTRSILTV